jgi:diaminopimelate epimerase
MQGCGNDFVIFDCFTQNIPCSGELSARLLDRHFGIGGDGVVFLLPPDDPQDDVRMRIFNSDGSEARMCGNATRCIGKYLYERGRMTGDEVRLETNSGVKIIKVYPEKGVIHLARVDMGQASLNPAALPAVISGDSVIGRETSLECGKQKITLVSMGNPHCVIFDSPDKIAELGPAVQRDYIFPESVNVELAEVIGDNTLRMRVWERGVGETLACGTGACATAVAAVENGLCDRSRPIRVELLGGVLTIEYTPDTVLMTGPAEIAFEGEVEI